MYMVAFIVIPINTMVLFKISMIKFVDIKLLTVYLDIGDDLLWNRFKYFSIVWLSVWCVLTLLLLCYWLIITLEVVRLFCFFLSPTSSCHISKQIMHCVKFGSLIIGRIYSGQIDGRRFFVGKTAGTGMSIVALHWTENLMKILHIFSSFQ